MKPLTLSPRDRRALLSGLWICAPVVLWAFALRPYVVQRTRLRDEIGAQRQILVRELGLVAAERGGPSTLSSQVTQQATVPSAALRNPDQTDYPAKTARRIFVGTDDEACAGAVAAYVRRYAAEHHVEVRQIAIPAVSSGGAGLRAIHVDMAATADLEALLSLVNALEGGDKVVSVDRLVVENSNRGDGHQATESLNVALSLSALGRSR